MKCTGALIILLISVSLKAQSLYFPPKSGNWDTTHPASLGWCLSEIDSLYDFLQKGDSKAFLVLKNGKIVLEKYFGSFTKDSFWYWASAGKTLTAMAVGIAAREGYLKLQDTSSKYLGKGWSSLTPEQEAKITVWHHITMTTGLNDLVSDPDCTDKSCLTYKADAGTRWAYHNAPYTLCDKIIEGATGQSLNAFINARIKGATGMDGAFIKLGYNNVFFSTAASMARYGLLMLNSGKWSGTEVLNDTVYFKSMTNSTQTLNKSYGYLTWLNGKQSFMVPGLQTVFPGSLMPDAPSDMFAALGKNSQYINVVPSKGIVLIRMGNDPPAGGGLVPAAFNNNIWKYMNRIMCNNTGNYRPGKAETSVTIFPNPARAEINISSALPVMKCEILRVDGTPVKEFAYSRTISTQGMTAGMYFVRIFTPSATHTSRFILE